MDSPTIVTFDPVRMKDALGTDPALRGLLTRGYTVGACMILVNGDPADPAARQEVALVMMPPSSAQPGLPRWVPVAATACVVLMLVQVVVALAALL